jgi:hypothetical protein
MQRTMSESDPQTRRLVYGLLITLAAGLAAGRIAGVERLYEPSVHKPAGSDVPRPAWPAARPDPSPTFSSNDRSRWAAARALVENGTWVVGRRTRPEGKRYQDTGIIFEDGFQSVDKVLNPHTDEFYSTKPPLLTLLMAAEYWALKNAFGWTMAMPENAGEPERARVIEDRFHVTRVALLTFNLVPFVLYLAALAWLAERFGTSDWSRYFVVGAGAFATLVWPFLVSINNHTLAATAVAVLLVAVVRIREDGPAVGLTLLGGFAAGLSVCLELPALALAAGVFAYVAWHHPKRSLLFLAAALLPVAASAAAGYAQLGEWNITGAYAKFGTEWYQYEGSHWVPPGVFKRGIDFAKRNGETRAAYAFHLLIGHHGIFSLTPVMLLAVAGMAMSLWRWVALRVGWVVTDKLSVQSLEAKRDVERLDRLGALLGSFALLVSAVVIAFYLFQSDNYGGWSNGPRWLMFLSPLWLVCMLPALDAMAKSRWGRLFALLLLTLSILSMSYQSWNPWRHPWLYNWMESRGWVNY